LAWHDLAVVSAAILSSHSAFGSIRTAQFNIPVARQRQRETSGNTAALNRIRHGRVRMPTLLAITVFTSGVAGCLLLLSWLQHRTVFALALWGSAFIIAAIATTLIIARNTIPDFWSIVVGNALLAGAYGIVWSGVRNFEGKSILVVLLWRGS
jgi:hypothetical protein